MAKFDFIVKTGEMIENDEVPERHLCCAVFLHRGSITVSKLRNGYAGDESFRWRRTYGTIEAHMEMQTYLQLVRPDTENQIEEDKEDFKRSEAAREVLPEEMRLGLRMLWMRTPSEI